MEFQKTNPTTKATPSAPAKQQKQKGNGRREYFCGDNYGPPHIMRVAFHSHAKSKKRSFRAMKILCTSTRWSTPTNDEFAEKKIDIFAHGHGWARVKLCADDQKIKKENDSSSYASCERKTYSIHRRIKNIERNTQKKVFASVVRRCSCLFVFVESKNKNRKKIVRNFCDQKLFCVVWMSYASQ